MGKNNLSINEYYIKSEEHKKGRADFFVVTRVGVIDDPKYRKAFKGLRTTYDWLRANIVRGEMRNDKLNIKRDYYDKGKLAVAMSLRKLSKDLFLHRNTVLAHVDKLVECGAIEKKTVVIKDAFDNQEHNVYILGVWHEYKDMDNDKVIHREFFSMDDAFGPHQTTLWRGGGTKTMMECGTEIMTGCGTKIMT